MGYSTGMLRHRVEVLKVLGIDGPFGANSGRTVEQSLGSVWAAVDFQRGIKAVREGAVDGTDYVLIRMRWNNIVTRECLLRCEGVTYQITELHADRMENIIQIKAEEIVMGAVEQN